jgi:hypothetical protein
MFLSLRVSGSSPVCLKQKRLKMRFNRRLKHLLARCPTILMKNDLFFGTTKSREVQIAEVGDGLIMPH